MTAAALPHPRRGVHLAEDRRADPAAGPGAWRCGSAWRRRRSRSPSSSGPRSTPAPRRPRWRSCWPRSRCVGGLVAAARGREGWGFLGTFLAIGLGVAGLFLALFPDVMPSTLGGGGLTTTNAAATAYTLKIMTVVAVVFTPLVLLYQSWTYWVFRKRIAVHHIPEAGVAARARREAHRPAAAAPARPRRGAPRRGPRGRGGRQPADDRPGLRGGRAGRGGGPGDAGRRPGPARRRGLRRPRRDRLGRRRVRRARAARVGTDVRRRLVLAALRRPTCGRADGGFALLATRGVAAVEPYLTRYLPALVLAGVLPVLTVLAIATQDLAERRHRAGHAAPGAGVRRAGRAWRPGTAPRPSGGPWLPVRPLPRRGPGPADAGGLPAGRGAVGADPRGDRPLPRATLRTLRLAFASSAVLELVATLSVALVAVTVGVRLAAGDLGLRHRAGGAAAGPRGLLAAAPGRCRVPRRRRGRGRRSRRSASSSTRRRTRRVPAARAARRRRAGWCWTT